MKKITGGLLVMLFGLSSYGFGMNSVEVDPVQAISSSICSVCTEEGYNYNAQNKCLLPVPNSGTIQIDCSSVTPCKSLGGEWYGGGKCCIGENNVVVNGQCKKCEDLTIEENQQVPGKCKTCEGLGKVTLKDGKTCCALNGVYDNDKKCCEGVVKDKKCYECSVLLPLVLSGSTTVTKEEYAAACSDNTAACPGKAYTDAGGASKCCDGSVLNGNCIQNTYGKMGIEIDQDCLINGQCKFNIYKVLNIRKSDQDTISVKTFAQDVLLALTTFFGVLLTAIVVISGLFYVLTPLSEPLKARAKKGLLAGLSGLFLVIGSYAIVRFVQFIATGGGG